ncbi:endopolygalacturonase [Dictyobacter alpinus]|uniref:Endopolygalacturonase n=1 Tax=Dictyobacter alpinus TaxID=2014873 RepID=A0A402BIW7_9CHLR|nr:glycosyl hydrolase family 28 protein [Dictyobacter alpinus]GCE31276.1 endopolygalacturonase [Dictyobacter alpinus]
MILYPYPRALPRSDEIAVFVNGQALDVLQTGVAYFVSVSSSEELQVEIISNKKLGPLTISPQRLGVVAEVADNCARFQVKNDQLLHIVLEGVTLPLFFYANPEDSYDGKATYYFAAGQIHEVGELVLHDNESIYIEGGAVVRGSIRATDAAHIKIYGNGILDGSYFKDRPGYRTILLYRCSDIEIQGIIMIEPSCWMIMLAACSNVHVARIKQIGEIISSDGIDVVGSHDVLIEHCILRNNDDCIVLKGFNWTYPVTGETYHAVDDVYNILVRSCTIMTGRAGNALEIGHELTINEVRDVIFSDLDIVSVHGHGAPFGIHVGDRALVRNILFEHIRVEHYYDKLIDFRVIRSRFNIDEERGHIQDIVLKDIHVALSIYNPGYSISVIGGYDENHQVQGVTLEDVYLGGTKVTNSAQLDLFTREARGIVFR